MSISASPISLNLLSDRDKYQHCHLAIADEENPSAGIQVDGEYYIFFRVVNDLKRGTQLIERLTQKNHKTVVTIIPKGYAIWVYEPSACIHHRRSISSKPSAQRKADSGNSAAANSSISAPSPSTPAEIRPLTTGEDYFPCKIQVPDLDKPLTGIQYRSQLYSLLRIVRDEQQATSLAQRLFQKGNQAVISSTPYGYSVWVLEPDGTAV